MKIVFSKKPKAPPRSLYVIAGEGAAEDGQRNRFHDGCTPLTAIVCVIMVVPALCWISAIWWAAAWTKSEEFKPGLSLEMAVELKRFPDVDLQDACLDLEDQDRFDCNPDPDVTAAECASKGCCWGTPKAVGEPLNIPYCYYPLGYKSYQLVNATKQKFGFSAFYSLMKASGYPNDIPLLRMDIMPQTQSTLRIKIFDPLNERYEVPFYDATKDSTDDLLSDVNLQYQVKLDAASFGFQVLRTDGKVIFDTVKEGGFVFADQLLQLSTLLPSHFVFGLGEQLAPVLKSTAWTQYTMWNFDSPPYPGTTNLYGSHPFYLVMEESGQSHGVFLKNSNAMEVILQPTPALTFRSLGGVLDLYIFLGPSPKSVVEQYTAVIGRPFLPPYWSLGYHQCRFGYGSLNRTREVLRRTQAAGIPIDVQWNDIDYAERRNDFTIDTKHFSGIKEFVEELHKEGLHYVMIIDPGLPGSEPPGTYPPYERGMEMDVFLKNSTGKLFIGRVWNNDSTVFVDFTHPNASAFWTEMLQQFHNKAPIDGAWIDMNEPSNFEDGQKGLGCPGHDRLDHPPYSPRFAGRGRPLYTKTVCPSARQAAGRHYNLHNTHGWTETMVTHSALAAIRPGKRPFIISRSTFPGQGHYGGHWTGDIHSDWDAMRMSIAGILNFNILGIPMVGADICGFNGNTTTALCQRWMELGAFYPFARNHNTDTAIDQDPVALGPSVIAAARKALRIRYTLLPYLYTLFVRAHLQGTPVARALFLEFPEDRDTYYSSERQFLLGPSLMVSPALQEDENKVETYVPRGRWFDYYTHKHVDSVGEFFVQDAPPDTIPLLVRGGTIMVRKPPANTTTQSRRLPFTLRVYLDSEGQAEGELFWDDGDNPMAYETGTYNHVVFRASRFSQLRTMVLKEGWRGEGFERTMTLSYVGIFGVKGNSSRVTLNEKTVGFYYNKKHNMLGVPNLKHDLSDEMILEF